MISRAPCRARRGTDLLRVDVSKWDKELAKILKRLTLKEIIIYTFFMLKCFLLSIDSRYSITHLLNKLKQIFFIISFLLVLDIFYYFISIRLSFIKEHFKVNYNASIIQVVHLLY